MTTYSSKARRGFFSDEIFGAPTVLVVDPDWRRPTYTATLQPGETVYLVDHSVTNNTNEPIEVPNVPDMTVDQPMVEVPNPDCRLPTDAKPLTEEMRAALLSAPHGINWDVEPPTAATAPVLNPAQAWAAYQQRAAALLNATDAELAGLVEYLAIGQPLPTSAATLVTYRRALRAIVTAPGGDPNLALPARG